MKKVAFYTLGCKVNQYETEAMSGIFEKDGYSIVDFDDVADVYVINTCTVTNLSDRKSRQMIRRAKNANKNAIVAVVGCYAQIAPDEVSGISGVNLVIGTKERGKILDYIKKFEMDNNPINIVSDVASVRKFEELKIDSFKDRTRAFLKIQEGCNQFCTYCIIPYARGPIRSRLPQDVINEVGKLADAGFKEIVLTGIHIASYGKDLKNTSLTDIIKKVHDIDKIERLRLGSLEPMAIDAEFIEMAKKLNKLCPHFHISLQSGCDETLARMNRKYTTYEYKEIIRLLRTNIKDVAITTDVMVGFPGETDEEFEKTYNFLKEISFEDMHIFKYSPRKGTPAAGFEGQVVPQVKEERSSKLIELAKKNAMEFGKKYLGRVLPVLFEREYDLREGYLEGVTSNYLKILVKADSSLKGEIVDVVSVGICGEYILGEINKLN